MRKLINKEELKKEWVIENWYEKLCYVVGLGYMAIIGISFVLGFIGGLFDLL